MSPGLESGEAGRRTAGLRASPTLPLPFLILCPTSENGQCRPSTI